MDYLEINNMLPIEILGHIACFCTSQSYEKLLSCSKTLRESIRD